MSSSPQCADPGRSCGREAFVACLDGDVSLGREMALTFVAEAPGLFGAVSDALRDGDAERLPPLVTRLRAAAPSLIAAPRAFGGSGSCES